MRQWTKKRRQSSFAIRKTRLWGPGYGENPERTSLRKRGRNSHSGSWRGSSARSSSCCKQAEERLRRPPSPTSECGGPPIRSRLRDTVASGRASRVLHHPLHLTEQRVPDTSAWLAREVASTTPPTEGPEVNKRPRLERMHGEVLAIAHTACDELNGCRWADLPVFLRGAAANRKTPVAIQH